MASEDWEKNIYERDLLQLRRSSTHSSANIDSSSTKSKKSKLRRGLSKLIPSKRKSNPELPPVRAATPPFPLEHTSARSSYISLPPEGSPIQAPSPALPPSPSIPNVVPASSTTTSISETPIPEPEPEPEPEAELEPTLPLPPLPPSPPAPSLPEEAMAAPAPANVRLDDPQAQGNRRPRDDLSPTPGPNSVLYQPPGALLKGATDENGELKPAALMLGIKLDLEAEVHLTARVRGDITIGLY